MKRLVYFMIISMSLSLAFSGGKPCCNKKTGKNAVACKFNQATITDANKTEMEKLINEGPRGTEGAYKCDGSNKNKCTQSPSEKPWWKLWEKKKTDRCSCKQSTLQIKPDNG